MSDLSRRVASLEDGAPGPCPECGSDSRLPVRYAVVWEDEEGAPKESSPPCPRCGNQDVFVIPWPDLPTKPPTFDGAYKELVPDYLPWPAKPEGGGE